MATFSDIRQLIHLRKASFPRCAMPVEGITFPWLSEYLEQVAIKYDDVSVFISDTQRTWKSQSKSGLTKIWYKAHGLA